MIEDDTHDLLVKTFIEYSKVNEKWETKRSQRTYYATQKLLREIHRLSKLLQKENTKIYNKKFVYKNQDE